MITVLVAPEALAAGAAEIRGETYRHLFRSRRLPQGSRLRLVDGLGGARWATVEEVGPKAARLVCGQEAPRFEPRPAVRLLVAAPRFQRASWLVEKATELGVAEIRWLTTERSAHSYGESNLERLRRVAAGALEQSHGCRLPILSGMHGWEEIPGLTTGCSSRWLLDPGGDSPGDVVEDGDAGDGAAGDGAAGDGAAGDGAAGDSVALLVGPEGGLADGERQALLDAGWQGRQLGPRILRVETAAIVGAAAALGIRL